MQAHFRINLFGFGHGWNVEIIGVCYGSIFIGLNGLLWWDVDETA